MLSGTGVASFNSYAAQDGDDPTACGPDRRTPTVGNPNGDPTTKVYAAGLNDLGSF